MGRKKKVKVPKTKMSYCKKKHCKKYTKHNVTFYKTGKASLYVSGKRRYDKKQSGFGGQTKPIFTKKVKKHHKILLCLQCIVCKTKNLNSIKRCKEREFSNEEKINRS